MTDWRELPSGAELNMVIALRLGYTIEEHDVKPDYHGIGYYLKAPDGGYAWNKSGYSRPKPAINRWEPIEFFVEDTFIPDWSRSVDAALTLLPLDRDCNMFWRHSDHATEMGMRGWNCILFENTPASVHANADTPALAVCRAWLAWQDREAEDN